MTDDSQDSGRVVARLLQIAASLRAAWQPAPALNVNGTELRVVRFEGHFSGFHRHQVDECYVVLEGELVVEVEGEPATHLRRGDAYVVRAGVSHRPFAMPSASVLLIT